MLETIAVAFSLFSAVPVPQFEWNERNMRFQLVAFPLVGALIALIVWGWTALVGVAGWGEVLYAAGLVAFPILVTGGFHLDGFCDTQDAIASHQPKEKKLEIMEDSHSGAFAIIGLGVYLAAYLGFATQLLPNSQTVIALAGLYVMTRAASGFAVASFPLAGSSGLAKTFADMASKRKVAVCDGLVATAAAVLAIWLSGFVGAGMVAGVLLVLLIYRVSSKAIFGGITGDLAGWFLQLAELAGVVGMVLAYTLCG